MNIRHFRHAGKAHYARTLATSRNVAVGIIALALIASCQKNGVTAEAQAAKIETPKMKQMTKYLSVIMGMSQDKIIYDQAADAFLIANTKLSLQRKTVEEQYDAANEYKLNYEN